MEPIRVLYVEDDPADQELIRRYLERHAPELKLRIVETVAEALDQLAVDDVDVILVDYRLPDGTGLDLLEAIKAREFQVPVVLVTVSENVETAVALLQAGAVDYVVKRRDYLATLPAVLEGAVRWFRSMRELRQTGIRVLYAEDDAVDVELTRHAFGRHGAHFQLDVAWRGRDALERLKAVPYDLLLLDYRMPDLSGIEILKALREQRIRIPVVMVTGQGEEEVAAQAFKLGVSDYVVKREGYLAKLPSTVENVVIQRRLADDNDALLILNTLAESIATVKELSDLKQVVAGAAKDLLQANMSILWLVDGGELSPAGWGGIDESVARALRFRVDAQALERAATKRRVTIEDLLGAASRLSPAASVFGDAGRSLAVSLIAAGRVIGVLGVTSLRFREFSAAEERLLTILADHAAIAIENIRLYQQLRDQFEELQRTQAQLVQTEKLAAMGSLLAGVAHELNNPLGVVVGETARLRQTLQGGPLEARAERLAQAAERCAQIVRSFLALARGHRPERKRVGLNQVVHDAMDLLGYQLQVDGVEVRLDLAPDLPVLWADPQELHQVVVNLVTNAHQAMREAPRPRRLTLVTRSEPERARVSLEVADTGPGIRPEILGRIFEPFFTTKAQGQGMGWGLSLCHAIVERQGGTIRVESQPGQGAIFRIELPVESPRVGVAATQAAEGRPRIGGKAILLVDDEPLFAAMLAETLSADAHQVETATNGAIALDKLRARTFDLILCDIRMPVLDGPGFYRELERRHPELLARVIFITGDVLSERTQEFLRQTRAPSLIKPFSTDALYRVIRQVLEVTGG